MDYSKKQMQPLITKYGIDVNTDKLFEKIIKMYANKPNYQYWAINAIFGKELEIGKLEEIFKWSKDSHAMIKNLSKKNIVSYASKEDFDLLFKEIKGIEMINTIKNSVKNFNTDQRKLFYSTFKLNNVAPIEAYENIDIKLWSLVFEKFESLPESRKVNIINSASAIRDLDTFFSMVIDTLKESYAWEKNNFLSFVEKIVPECPIVVNQGPIVILEITSFRASHILCGNGRTNWCIAYQESSWVSYSNRTPTYHQFFMFDFSKEETDQLAHIGFTIDENDGIIYAHSTENDSLLDGIQYNNEIVTLSMALSMANIKMSQIMPRKKLKYFKWEYNSIIDFVKKDNSKRFSLAYAKDNKIIIHVLSPIYVDMLLSGSFCNKSRIKSDIYVIFNLDKDYMDNESTFVLEFKTDEYGIINIWNCFNTYNLSFNGSKCLKKLGVSTDDFIKQKKINPNVLLHKYLDEYDEDKAIELIDKNDKDLDVNYSFSNGKIPAFVALNNLLFKAFEKIINHHSFKNDIVDGYGEPILHNLFFIFNSAELDNENWKHLKRIIENIIENDKFDLNIKDMTGDTPLHIACLYSNLFWIVEKLINNDKVNINIENSRQLTPLESAIITGNIKAIKILCKRSDLIIRDKDFKMAQERGIDLKEFLK